MMAAMAVEMAVGGGFAACVFVRRRSGKEV